MLRIGCYLLFVCLPVVGFGQIDTIWANPTSGVPHLDPRFFLYPSFKSSAVQLKTGKKKYWKLNYDVNLEKLVQINKNSDTLALNTSRIKYVVIDNDTLYYNHFVYGVTANFDNIKWRKKMGSTSWSGGWYEDKNTGIFAVPYESVNAGFYRIAAHLDKFKLAQKWTVGYEVDSSADVTEQSSYFILSNPFAHRPPNIGTGRKILPVFFIIDLKGDMYDISEENLLLFYPNKRRTLASYIETQNVSLNSKKSLLQLFNWLASKDYQ